MFKEETRLFYIRTQCVPRSKHSPSRLYKISLLVMYIVKVIIEHLMQFEYHVEFWNVEPDLREKAARL